LARRYWLFHFKFASFLPPNFPKPFSFNFPKPFNALPD
jgi:hypothetical protein